MTLVNRLLGRNRVVPDVTTEEIRKVILERQQRQEARLRALDLQAEVPARRRR